MVYFNSGFIASNKREPTQNSASGIFDLRAQQIYKSASEWPLTPGPPVIASNLLCHLDAGNSSSYSGTGTNWYDLTSNNADATLNNGASYSSSDGGYIDFDGANDYAEISESNLVSNTIFTGSNSYSVSLWFNADSFPSSTNSLYAPVLFVAAKRFALFTIGDNEPTNKLGWRGKINNSFQTVVLSDALSLNTWYNICVTYDPTSGFILYQNGSSVDTNSTTGTHAVSTLATNGSQIGGWTQRTGRDFDGSVSSVLIYDKTLSSTEVTNNFDSIKQRYGL